MRPTPSASWVLVGTAVALLTASPRALARTDPIELTAHGTSFALDAPDGMAGFAQQAAGVVQSEWPRVSSLAGAPLGASISIHIEREMDDWFEREGLPPSAPEWAAGLAVVRHRTILLVPGVPDWESTLVHELAHMALALATGDAFVPRWLHEGYAIAVAEQWGIARATTMIRAGITGNTYDFDDLTRGFPAAASSADLAYAQSFHLVRYIGERHGTSTLASVFAAMRAGAPWEEAYLATTGENVAATIVSWEDHVATRYHWIPLLSGSGVAWSIAAALMVLGWRRRKRRIGARMAKLAARERSMFRDDPDDTTFG